MTTDSLQPIPPSKIFAALLLRDVKVARRELPYFLIRTTLQPLLFVIVFGYLLPRMGMLPPEYTATMLPGVVALSLTLSAIQSVALPMVQDFGFTHEIEDRLLAPVSLELVALEKIVAGLIQGVIAAAFVLPISWLIMGPIPGLSFERPLMIAWMTLLGGATFSALGLYLGTAISPAQIGLMFSVILGPMIMFGCTYYPWRGLSAVPFMQYVVLVNPLVYVAEGMRAALTPGVPHMSELAVSLALLVLFVTFTLLGLRTFRRRAVS